MQVVFLEKERRQVSGQTMTRRVHRGADAKSAEGFLGRNVVTTDHHYLVVKTPEGTHCRDSRGIYKE